MWRTDRKKSHRRNWKRFARRSRHKEFCSKFGWSAGSSRNGKRLQRPVQLNKALQRVKGTKHDPAKGSVENKFGLDRCRGAVVVSRVHASGADRGDSTCRRKHPPGLAACSGKRTRTQRARTGGARKGAGAAGTGSESQRR